MVNQVDQPTAQKGKDSKLFIVLGELDFGDRSAHGASPGIIIGVEKWSKPDVFRLIVGS